MLEVITDNNEFLSDGSTNPNYGQTTIVEHPDPPLVPKNLSKTAFMDLCWTQLGGGSVGMARFNVIMTACKTGDDILQAIYDRYVAADIFNKTLASQMLALMVGANVMEQAEADAVLNNW